MSSLGFLNPLNSSTFTRENKNPEFGLGNPFFSFLKKPFTDNKYFPAGTSYLKSEYCNERTVVQYSKIRECGM